ncbi:MAG: DUF1697 domain-containing protein [bacterium]|nr:DUF1697 domain-containing protein [bacterium]
MESYIVLLRGINVGGKNKVSMGELRKCLEELGCSNVKTYINSGNVLLQTNMDSSTLSQKIESILPQRFDLDSSVIKVLVLTVNQLQAIVDNKPKGFGEYPDRFHSDAIFLIGLVTSEAMKVFDPRVGVDKIWPGKGVVYSQRLSSVRTKSRLGKIIGTAIYQSMTIRSWNTTTKLLLLVKATEPK